MQAKDADDRIVDLPACFSREGKVDRNKIRQLLISRQQAKLVTKGGSSKVLTDAGTFPVVRSKTTPNAGAQRLYIPASVDLTSVHPTIEGARWLGKLLPSKPEHVLRSLADQFNFKKTAGDQPGLREPQMGALHSVLGYWTTRSVQPATIVMPTGTGKTETMLALFAAGLLPKLMVLVPSDALRDQIGEKFETLGVLQEFGVVSKSALRPLVGRVQHRFSSETDAETFAKSCNVIVATPAAVFSSTPAIREALLGACSHLFIDEAHHVAASTWQTIRLAFEGKPVVQFTATPFREDGRHLGGKLLYAFPLREAQAQGFFSTINYISVVDFLEPEASIADRAIQQLRSDLEKGFDHLLMARVKRIGRAHEVQQVYSQLAPDLNPVVMHSELPKQSQRAARQAIADRTSRIIVCVDMLGEGFDLPSLKVAAIHDPHKSIGVTLQFIGRFARASTDTIGEATVVVGRPDLDYDDTLRRLYSEDADWNLLVRDISETAVGQVQEISEFEEGFNVHPDEVSLRNLMPAMSTVVYKTEVEWKPDAITDIFPEDSLLTFPVPVNANDHVAWFVTEQRTDVRWGDIKTVEEITHHLYVMHWDPDTRLLYVNSSNNDSLHEELAKALCPGAERLRGEAVYRVMAHIRRLVPTNVGVLDIRNRARRFSLHVGADVSEGFPVAEAQSKTKTNIFAYGYDEGERVSIGASLKGRIWSYKVAGSIKEWIDWCHYVGSKILDDAIDVSQVMKDFIRPLALENRPDLIPIAMEWPWELFLSTSEEVRLTQGDEDPIPLVDVDLNIVSHNTEGPIQFTVSGPLASYQYQLDFDAKGMGFKVIGDEAYVVTQRTRTSLSDFLNKRGLMVFLEKDATIVPPGMLLKIERELPPYDPANLIVTDWTGINIRKESQGAKRDADSIQARILEHIKGLADWDLVVDDDSSGELADIVAMRLTDDCLYVHLTHCKFSSEDNPGARIEDLYDVCGQAQKSARWKRNLSLMFRHLIRREKNRNNKYGRTGILVGDATKLYNLEDKSRFGSAQFTIAIAQPGMSKASASAPMLEVLASTEVYVHETALASLEVYCSE